MLFCIPWAIKIMCTLNLGDVEQLALGIKYTNRYCTLAHVTGGQILLFREYFHALMRQTFEPNGF